MSALPRLLPVYLEETPSATFHRILEHVTALTVGQAEWLPPAHISQAPAIESSAIVVPDFSGRVYRLANEFQAIAHRPIILATSEHGTVFMWDWEGRDWLRKKGIPTLAPTSAQELSDMLRALAVKEAMPRSTMLAYWDDLGAGQQPDIFKRFYWWEDECSDTMTEQFGITIQKRSFRELVARADAIGEARLQDEMARVESLGLPIRSELARKARADALRLKLALDDELDETPGVIAAGINCLNESATSVTTPCLAWNLLYEERGLIWGCEADLTSMITEYLVNKTLNAPLMMTNLYPFLMGGAALDHERIPHFPAVPDEPENYILAAHCGFFGLMPPSMSRRWVLNPPVLAIVNENAHMVDAELETGDLTLVKIAPSMDHLAVTVGELVRYEQYENSDCLNGGLIKVPNGPRFVENLPSHHYILAQGNLERRLDNVARILELDTVAI